MYKNVILYFTGLFIMSLLYINASCKEQKSKQVEKIIVGSGGGFTGITKEYIINKDGTVQFQQGDKKEAGNFGKLSKKQLHEMAKKAEAQEFHRLELNEPGNFYYYIEIRQKDKNHRVTWSSQVGEGNKKMQEFYSYLMDMISKSKNNK